MGGDCGEAETARWAETAGWVVAVPPGSQGGGSGRGGTEDERSEPTRAGVPGLVPAVGLVGPRPRHLFRLGFPTRSVWGRQCLTPGSAGIA